MKWIRIFVLTMMLVACSEAVDLGNYYKDSHFECGPNRGISLDGNDFIIGVPASEILQIYKYEPVGEYTYKIKNLSEEEVAEFEKSDMLTESHYEYKKLVEEEFFKVKGGKLYYPLDSSLTIKEMDNYESNDFCREVEALGGR